MRFISLIILILSILFSQGCKYNNNMWDSARTGNTYYDDNVDNVAPAVLDTYPVQADVLDADSPIYITFSETVIIGQSSIYISDSSENVIYGEVELFNASPYILAFTPSEILVPGSYNLVISDSIKDLSGNYLAENNQVEFTVENIETPAIYKINPDGSTSITPRTKFFITFNMAMSNSTGDVVIEQLAAGDTTPVPLVWSWQGISKIKIEPSVDFQPGSEIIVYFNNFSSLENIELAADPYHFIVE